jgi:hypothetical protein
LQSDYIDPNAEFYDDGNYADTPSNHDYFQSDNVDSDVYQQSHFDDAAQHPRDDMSGYFVHAPVSFSCEVCCLFFPSRNKLFKHVRLMNYQKKATVTHAQVVTNMFAKMGSSPAVIKSEAPSTPGSGLSFHDYNYLEIAVRSSPTATDQSVCVDTGCGMSCMDKEFFNREFPNVATSQITPIEIRGLGSKTTESSEYAIITLFLPGYTTSPNTQALAEITREFHIVDKLSCNALIGNDIIEPEGITIDVKMKKAKITSCKDLVCPL